MENKLETLNDQQESKEKQIRTLDNQLKALFLPGRELPVKFDSRTDSSQIQHYKAILNSKIGL
ncbi:hypothetical protein [Parachlamydia sp. AcF125]|uniref:hypothetical protein n=1 Tax=Parachlamydia sp. AcF125 TaxID=2795736 RepID=UPI001BC94324|nr:hypothetical protein [Parachlamydia sp. AcF125]